MTAPTVAQAESWLPFLERVGLPWLAFLIMLAVNLAMGWFFSAKLLPELRAIALALQSTTSSTARLAEEVHANTPAMGMPAVPAWVIDVTKTLKGIQDELAELRRPKESKEG